MHAHFSLQFVLKFSTETVSELVDTFIFPGLDQCDFGGSGRLAGGHRPPVRSRGQTPLPARAPVPRPALLTPPADRASTAPSVIGHVLIVTVLLILGHGLRIGTTYRNLNFLLPANGLQTKRRSSTLPAFHSTGGFCS